MSVIESKYERLFEFLAEYYNQEALDETEGENALDLIEFMVEELFVEEYDVSYVRMTIEQMESFLAIPIHESGKSLYIKNHVGVEMIGLTPVQFLRFLYYRLKAEQWKRK